MNVICANQKLMFIIKLNVQTVYLNLFCLVILGIGPGQGPGPTQQTSIKILRILQPYH